MDAIDELLIRGVDTIYPTKAELEKILRSGKKLRVYQGFDPTSPELHIGHMVGLRKLRQWQDLGHHVIFLIGDFTGMVGDPTGKDKTRVPLTREQVLENAKTYKEQAGKILRFEGENAVEIKHNSEWLAKLSSLEFARLASQLTFQQVIERDMFQRRIKNKMDIAISEFLYPFMQAYDSVAMDIDVEVGGTDQMFNMMVGRDLMHKLKRKNKFVMTTPLLTDAQGNKIGKSEGNVIALTDDPKDLFGKLMALPDDVVVKGFEYLTDLPMTEVEHIKKNLEKGANPIDYKKKLAFEMTKLLNNKEAAQSAQEYFEKTVQKKETPEEIAVLTMPLSNKTVIDALEDSSLVPSRSEGKRLIEQGGVTVNEKRINDPNARLDSLIKNNEIIIKVGKYKFLKIKPSA